MSRFLYRFRWHILFWALYFIGWASVSVYGYHSPLGIALAVTFVWFLGQAAMIYVTIYRWMPRYLKPRRIGLFVLAVTGSIVGSTLFIAPIDYLLLKLAARADAFSVPATFGYVLLGNIYWIFLAVAFTVFRDRLRTDRRNQRLEKEHIENELRFLKSQMNPHFLFNAINSIYVLIKKDPDLAQHTLAQFSDMLRYQLYDCSTDFIPIEKEITYLENYIRLEQLRKGSMLLLDYQTDGSVGHFSVAPLLLIPLIENAFKFVSSYSDRVNEIRIRFSFIDGWFCSTISNTVDESPPPPPSRPGSGIGLENIRRRLELLYPGRHSLEIDAQKDYFTISFKLLVV